MIEAFTIETAHLLGDALPQVFRLRHKMFVERHAYNVPTLRGMEWDQFDTPACVYLLWRDGSGSARAVGRLIPTTFPYMIKQLWPGLVASGQPPSRPDVWEISRLGVDRDMPPSERRRALGAIVCACGEFGLLNGITSFLLVTHPRIVRRDIASAGWRTEVLGEPRLLGRFRVIAVSIEITRDSLNEAYRYYDCRPPVLRLGGTSMPQDTTENHSENPCRMPRAA